MVPEAHVICAKMRNDLHLFLTLRAKYPGAFLLIRYEDLVMDLRGTLDKMYSHFGEQPAKEVYDKMYDMMHAPFETDDKHMFSVNRSNATASLYKWLNNNDHDEIEGMTKHCSDVLQQLGYPYHMTKNQRYTSINI